MIKSGGTFSYKGKTCIIGAVISFKGSPYIIAASHIFKGVGDLLSVEGIGTTVKSVFKENDLALIEVPSGCAVEFTEFGSAVVLENALLVNDIHTLKCRVINAGSSLIYLNFSYLDMPQPGDSGSPIVQKGKVIGLLSSLTLNSCMGTAISAAQFPRLFGSRLK